MLQLPVFSISRAPDNVVCMNNLCQLSQAIRTYLNMLSCRCMSTRRLFDIIKVRMQNRPARLFDSHNFVKCLLQCHTDMSRMIPSLTVQIANSVRRCPTAIGKLVLSWSAYGDGLWTHPSSVYVAVQAKDD